MLLVQSKFFVFVYLLIISISIKAVYGLDDEQPFKINKLNLIWHKAQHSLGSGKLKDLKSDLTKHEFDQLTLKKMKAHNQDKDGIFEASIRKKLLNIMKKYSLEKYYDDIHPPVEDEHIRKKENLKILKEASPQSGEFKATFRDKRLDKLWKKAEQSSFTQEQLMILYDEFQHQQDKLDDHYETLNMIEEEIELKAKEGEKWENSIENTMDKENKRKPKKDEQKESPADKKNRLEENIHQVLKDKYSDIKKNIDNLHKKILSGEIVDGEGPFEEAAVNDLWSSAMKANFTGEELESLKEELGHYQNRIKKLKHYQVQFERNKIVSTKDSGDEIDNETKHLRKRVKELTHKVDKTHKSIEDRITKRRDEL